MKNYVILRTKKCFQGANRYWQYLDEWYFSETRTPDPNRLHCRLEYLLIKRYPFLCESCVVIDRSHVTHIFLRCLTHCGLVITYSVVVMDQVMTWICSMLSHYLNQCWLIISCPKGWEQLSVKLESRYKYFLWRKYILNAVCKISAILCKPQCVQDQCFYPYIGQTILICWGLPLLCGDGMKRKWGF